jgi:carbon monoxide dehydrogenase subunit G
MPGAELAEVVDENTWKAKLSVKLGPIALQFGTDVRREEVDEAARRVTLQAKARELRGRGGAQATIASALEASEAGTHVTIVTDLSLQGAVAQYGRGVVADVASQLTKRFADCIASQLADAPEEEKQAALEQQSKPVSGLRLGLGAVLRAFLALLRRR